MKLYEVQEKNGDSTVPIGMYKHTFEFLDGRFKSGSVYCRQNNFYIDSCIFLDILKQKNLSIEGNLNSKYNKNTVVAFDKRKSKYKEIHWFNKILCSMNQC